MKIDKIEIKNFRNYLGKHVFKLNKHITILYGENGNGKSSFFDALEWGLTGNISRFNGNKTPKEVLANKKISLYDDCYVEIYFSNLCIKRTFSYNEDGFGKVDFSLNRVPEDGERELVKITSGEENVDSALRNTFQEQGVNFKDLKYKVGEIIKKAYILSQDQVTDFVTRDRPNDRYNALASIMGFEKIVKVRKNISNSKKVLDESVASLNTKEESLKEDIKKQQKKLKNIDVNILNHYRKQYSESRLEENILHKQYDSLQRNIYKIEENISFFERVKLQEIGSLYNLNRRIEEKEEKKGIYENKINNLTVKSNDAQEKLKQLEGQIKRILKKENLEIQLENIEKQMKELENNLASLNLKVFPRSFDNLKYNVQKLEEHQKLISYVKKYKKEYEKAKQIIASFNDDLHKEKILLYTKQDSLDHALKAQEKLSENILIDDENSSLNELISGMEQVLIYVKDTNEREICPVCSSKVVERDLNVILESNIDNLINKLDEHKEQVAEQLSMKKQNNRAITELRNLIAKQENFIEELEFNFKIALNTVKRIEDNALFSELFLSNYKEIEEIHKQNNEEIASLNIGLKNWIEIEKLKEKMTLILSSQEDMKEGNLKKFQNQYQELQSESNRYLEEMNHNKSLLSGLNEEIFNLNQIKDKFSSFLKDYEDYNDETNIKDIHNLLTIKRKQFQNDIQLIREVEQIIKDTQYNSEIEQELKIFFVQLKRVRDDKKNLAKKAMILFQLISKIDREYGEETTDFLNNNDTIIQRYYRYLNPRPSEFNNLYFEITNNESLSIKILNNNSLGDKYTVDANMVLSSGQLNVLALAIFIATNQAQECSYFDFAAIDDPIQNMDDINRFSICDLLSNLNKQLIFSTHDQEFLNLFLKKNEHKSNFVTIYMLNAEKNKYKSIIM